SPPLDAVSASPPQPAARAANARQAKVSRARRFMCAPPCRRLLSPAADDVLDDVSSDVLDFFFAQLTAEGRHAAAAIGDLFDRRRFGFGFRHGPQVRAAVAAVAVGAVA